MEQKVYEEYVFKMRRLFAQMAFDDFGIRMKEDRLGVKYFAELEQRTGSLVRHILDIATMEDDAFDYPRDWWQAFKERWYPEWAKRKWPIVYNRVWAIHKFPEIDSPLAAEYVHFKRVEFVPEPEQS